jgi:predicted nucleotidyltransferase
MRQAVLTEQIKKELVDRIMASEKIDKILLFGSEATGDSGPESDIDLLVVLDQCQVLPHSFKERSANYLQISRAIRDIEKHFPIDLLVYTKPEFEMIKASGSLFIRRLLKDAVELK